MVSEAVPDSKAHNLPVTAFALTLTWTAAPEHWKESAEVPSQGGFSGSSNWEETSRKAQDQVERLYLHSGLTSDLLAYAKSMNTCCFVMH